MLAPCGLDCGDCDIFLATEHPEIAEKLAVRFKAQGHADAAAEWFHCCGCPGEKEQLWSGDCDIRACCVDEKNLRYCSDCPDFACERLETWSNRSMHYQAALTRLRVMKRHGA